jgi:hypothetical protein
MKILRLVFVLGLLLMTTTWVASAAPPDPPVQPGPAMFLDFPDCYIFDVDFNWYYIPDCSPTISLVTNSKTGVLLWTAQAQLPVDEEDVALPEKGAFVVTYENSGFACYWDDNTLTTNYSIIITPDGKFIANCHFRPGKWQPY